MDKIPEPLRPEIERLASYFYKFLADLAETAEQAETRASAGILMNATGDYWICRGFDPRTGQPSPYVPRKTPTNCSTISRICGCRRPLSAR